ncbi:ribokinase [Corynebacterium epidermidicanis]|uniref:Deoxyribokinase n=1 Tax=Corynebacterium epidermidicanis TaxID=1050174 RepID=A0A0G3GU37_9CORY|nr:ribokinase [Corynebacterium epidermidicanis]AKK02382.1 ribokinase [Corynebacterium epidermidicanis]
MIAVVGSNMVDLITYINRMPGPGETIEAPDFRMGCGGKGANQAVAAARNGAEVLMVTRVGNDAFAANTRANFVANGISTKYVLETEATSGVAPIFVDESSQNSILIVQGANARLSPEDVAAARADLAQCSLIVMQLEIPLPTVYYTIRLAKELGVPVLLNPAPAQPGLKLSEIADCTYFMPNESELALITGMPVTTLDEVRAAAEFLRRKGISNVIVTLGDRGVLCLNDDGETFTPPFPVAAVDTTGAGDAFIGCFSHAIDAGLELPVALRRAAFYAADSVTKRGTQYSYAEAKDLQFPA